IDKCKVRRPRGARSVQIMRGAGDGLPGGHPILRDLPARVGGRHTVVGGAKLVIRKKKSGGGFLADVALDTEHSSRSVVSEARIIRIDTLAGSAIRACQQADGPAADPPRQTHTSEGIANAPGEEQVFRGLKI